MSDSPKNTPRFLIGRARFGHEDEGIIYGDVNFDEFAGFVKERGIGDDELDELVQRKNAGVVQVIYNHRRDGAKIVFS
jgi:hypothetical protein